MAPKDIVTLTAKLSIPRLSETIRRERLLSFFSRILEQKVLLVVAGAGYGKTTFAVQACRHLGLPTVWYRLDASDQDFSTFIHYMVDGIAHHYADFGRETLARIASAQSVRREQHVVLATLLNEMDRAITQNLIIVLDDYHWVQESSEIKQAVHFMVQHMNDRIHLILTSRSTPDLPLSRLIAGRQAFDISEKDLAFNDEEIGTLYRDIFGIHLSDDTLSLLSRKTDGWVAGLILFNYMLKGKNKDDVKRQLASMEGGSRILYNYLEENIFHFLPEETSGFLTRTAILSRLEIDFCNELLDIDNAGEILTDLEQRHLFTFASGEGKDAFYYHQLFKDFLETKLEQKLGRKAVNALHERAAVLWENREEFEQSIDHWLCAGLPETACRSLERIGRQLIRFGRLKLFLSYYARIPDTIVEKHPWVIYQHGRALELSGKTQAAVASFDRAQRRFQKEGIAKGVEFSLNRLATIYYVIGDYSNAESRFKLLLKRVRTMPRLYVDALGHLVFIMSHEGMLDQADAYYAEAMKVLAEAPEGDLHAWMYLNYGFRHFRSGDLVRAKQYGEQSNALSMQTHLYHLLSLGYHLVAVSEYYTGNFEAGLEAARKGIQAAEDKGFIEAAYAWNWNSACLCATALGHYMDAIEYGTKGLQVCRELNSLWSQAWAHRSLTEAYLKSGDVTSAEQAARAALQAVETLNLAFDQAIMKTGLGNVLMEKGELDSALDLLLQAEAALSSHVLYLCRTRLFLAKCYWALGQRNAAVAQLKAALALGRQIRNERWLVNERAWLVPLLVALYPDSGFSAYVETLFERFGRESLMDLKMLREKEKGTVGDSAVAIMKKIKALPPPPLRIHCLGKFGLWRGSGQLHPDQWAGEKPTLLLKFLCSRQARGYVAKDRILEALWPDEAPEVTGKRLHVALTKLRRALEPELTRGMSSAYLLRKGDAYRLDLGPEGFLDINAFDAALTMAKKENNEDKALVHYLKAESIYNGHLFEEDRYTQWCSELSGQYREKYLDTLDHIIAGYRKVENWSKCIDYARKYVVVDEYAEEIYQMLMIFHNAMGNKSMIIKTYEQCKAKIEAGLDMLVGEETTELFKQLITM